MNSRNYFQLFSCILIFSCLVFGLNSAGCNLLNSKRSSDVVVPPKTEVRKKVQIGQTQDVVEKKLKQMGFQEVRWMRNASFTYDRDDASDYSLSRPRITNKDFLWGVVRKDGMVSETLSVAIFFTNDGRVSDIKFCTDFVGP